MHFEAPGIVRLVTRPITFMRNRKYEDILGDDMIAEDVTTWAQVTK